MEMAHVRQGDIAAYPNRRRISVPVAGGTKINTTGLRMVRRIIRREIP